MTNDDLAVFRERNTRKSLSNAAALIGKANDAVFEVCRPCFLGGRKIFCVYGKNSSLIRNRYV